MAVHFSSLFNLLLLELNTTLILLSISFGTLYNSTLNKVIVVFMNSTTKSKLT